MSAGGEHTNWQVGDLALCVRTEPNRFGDPHPCRKGGFYTVADVVVGTRGPDAGITGLRLEGVTFANTNLNADWAGNYRRVPPHTPDEFDTEVIELLNRKPVEA